MALKIKALPEHIKVIAQLDEAINSEVTDEVYQEYLITLDETLLKLNPELIPTRFVLQLSLDQKAHSKIMDAQMAMKNKEMEIKISYMLEEIRICLLDIENGEGVIAYKKDKDGYADKNLIGVLQDNGIVSTLFTARQNAIKTTNQVSKKN